MELKFFTLVARFMLSQAFGAASKDVITVFYIVSYLGQFQNIKLCLGVKNKSPSVFHILWLVYLSVDFLLGQSKL